MTTFKNLESLEQFLTNDSKRTSLNPVRFINVDSMDSQLEITCKTGPNNYTKHFVGLNEWVIYTVEDLSGADVDPYHYEIHYLPEGNVVNFKFKGKTQQ